MRFLKTESMVVSSPVGNVRITSEDDFLVKVEFVTDRESESQNKILQETAEQLRQYFAGGRETFDLPVKLNGTPFQEAVWTALCEIPFGSTCTYKDIADKIDNPKAVRAIGQANKANKLPIIIPCHRVIGKNRTLTGYAGKQVDKKEVLLQVEKIIL
ncbi:methylated-DNA--[protein]-cysteine S-methyltransferase [Rossellomorea vietnamensis]|uniref:Methylated-DNA--protein-cysteine methyltransferase n=1 Tax=Rossellomorea vietnamensis TaxID=218284 RepID=A0A5D4NPG5_9BACI|nr:methylated-DNA--[protein]-cysteine S-methyltransferase [Rossellomorea vietnamensis]TYS15769.1 methylated-DNA--[protein]-cysteine S-methyltransferase [Rossellomorea vietnamensis]